jgi:hypothetical protein
MISIFLSCQIPALLSAIVECILGLRTRSGWPRPVTLLLGVCLVIYCVLFITSPSGSDNQEPSAHLPLTSSSKRLTPELLNNLSLHEDECNAAFPGLTKDIDDTVGAGPFTVKQAGELGPLQGRIKDGQVRVRWVGISDL